MYSFLKLLMLENKISIKQMANTLSINVSTLSNKLNGKGVFGVDELTKIRDTYFPNRSLDDLIATSLNA